MDRVRPLVTQPVPEHPWQGEIETGDMLYCNSMDKNFFHLNVNCNKCFGLWSSAFLDCSENWTQLSVCNKVATLCETLAKYVINKTLFCVLSLKFRNGARSIANIASSQQHTGSSLSGENPGNDNSTENAANDGNSTQDGHQQNGISPSFLLSFCASTNCCYKSTFFLHRHNLYCA